MWRVVVVLVAAFVLMGTGPQRVELVIPKTCITKVELTDKSECAGPDKEHLTCHGLMLSYKSDCTQWRITREPDPTK